MFIFFDLFLIAYFVFFIFRCQGTCITNGGTCLRNEMGSGRISAGADPAFCACTEVYRVLFF
jgi:hypothetical protein